MTGDISKCQILLNPKFNTKATIIARAGSSKPIKIRAAAYELLVIDVFEVHVDSPVFQPTKPFIIEMLRQCAQITIVESHETLINGIKTLITAAKRILPELSENAYNKIHEVITSLTDEDATLQFTNNSENSEEPIIVSKTNDKPPPPMAHANIPRRTKPKLPNKPRKNGKHKGSAKGSAKGRPTCRSNHKQLMMDYIADEMCDDESIPEESVNEPIYEESINEPTYEEPLPEPIIESVEEPVEDPLPELIEEPINEPSDDSVSDCWETVTNEPPVSVITRSPVASKLTKRKLVPKTNSTPKPITINISGTFTISINNNTEPTTINATGDNAISMTLPPELAKLFGIPLPPPEYEIIEEQISVNDWFKQHKL